MKIQKFTATFLAVVLVTGAITIGTSILIDDAFASGDKHKKKHDRDRGDNNRHYDSDYGYKDDRDRGDKNRHYDSDYGYKDDRDHDYKDDPRDHDYKKDYRDHDPDRESYGSYYDDDEEEEYDYGRY